MSEKHRIATPDGRHFDLLIPVTPGVSFVTNGKQHFRLTGGGLQEQTGAASFVTWYGELVDKLDPNLTRARD